MSNDIDDICDASGIVTRAPRVLIYGASGQGKSTLASTFPEPLVLDTEKGTLRLNLKKRKFITGWEEMTGTLRTIIERRPGSIRTVVIDTIDWLVDLATKRVCEERKVKSIEDIQYKAGFTYVNDKIAELLELLTRINDMGYAVLLVAHARDEVLKLPGLDPFRVWNLKIVGTQNQAKQTAEKIREWADEVYFLDKDMKVDKGKATGGTIRLLYTQATASIIAKSRYGLGAESNPCILTAETLQPIFDEIIRSGNPGDERLAEQMVQKAMKEQHAEAPEPDCWHPHRRPYEQPTAPAGLLDTGFATAGLDERLRPYEAQLLSYCLRKRMLAEGANLSMLSAQQRNRINAAVEKVIEAISKEVAA